MHRGFSAVLLAALMTGCGGSTTDSGAPDAALYDAPPDATLAHAPGSHRPVAVPCVPAPLPPEPEIPDAGLGPGATFQCHVHADCTAKPRGRCIFYPTDPPYDPGGTRCVYDECTVDDDCPPDGVCACDNVANTCLPGNCRIDSDCGPGGYCSPSIDPCLKTTLGDFCHTAADTCIDDSDCSNSTAVGLPACEYDTTAGHWACSPGLCGASVVRR
jgi:hypothetical protein